MADLDAIRELIISEQARYGVPGLAVAVLRDGDVALCEGFGHADLDTGEPVDADTHFPLASDTKAFTAATLCLLADAGLIDLDAPVRHVLPWFELHDPHATDLVTVRDLLSHRTGLPRHDLVWFGNDALSLEEITRRLRHLPMSRPLRTVWDYNNLCYIAAGHITEAVTGTSWSEAVSARLLAPLGMTRTAFAVQDPAIRRLAQPYKAAERAIDSATDAGFARQELPARSTAEKAGPAGGLVSTIADLAQWLSARLGHRPDVLSTAALEQLHRPAMLGGISVDFDEITSLGYGLGCQIETYRGRRLVHHGGNTVGYSSDVCVVPGSGIGIAVLTNLDGSYLRLPLIYAIIDQLHGDTDAGWGKRVHDLQTSLSEGYREAWAHHEAHAPAAPPSRDLAEFVGTYVHPAYGELTIRLDGERLVPGFHDIAPDRIRLVHRGHDAWDLQFVAEELDCPLVFTQGMDGAVTGLAAALEPSVAPAVFARQPAPVPAELLTAMAGRYRMGPTTLVIRRRGTELVASSGILGDLVLTSGGGTTFSCAALPGIGVTAELDPDGAVSRIVIEQVGVFVPEA